MAFTENVLDSTQETDDDRYQKAINRLRKQTEAATRRYGNAANVGPTSVSGGAEMEAETKYRVGEYGRRKDAAEGKLDLAKQIDTRQSGVADRVRAALFDRRQLQSRTAEEQRKQDVTQGQELAEANQQFGIKSAQLEFSAIKNAADRMDAMQAAYDKGALEFQMIDLARSGQLELLDIQRYFELLKNDIANKLKDLDMENDFKRDEFKRDMTTKSNAMSSIMGGLTRIAQGYLAGWGE